VSASGAQRSEQCRNQRPVSSPEKGRPLVECSPYTLLHKFKQSPRAADTAGGTDKEA